MTRKIAVVGNTEFPIDAATGTEVVEVLRALPEDAVILTRGTQGFEQFVIHAALVLGRRCFTYRGKGGGDNLVRDEELVADADEVIAFIALSLLDDMDTGAINVVRRAIAAGKPIRAASAVDGALIWA